MPKAILDTQPCLSESAGLDIHFSYLLYILVQVNFIRTVDPFSDIFHLNYVSKLSHKYMILSDIVQATLKQQWNKP